EGHPRCPCGVRASGRGRRDARCPARTAQGRESHETAPVRARAGSLRACHTSARLPAMRQESSEWPRRRVLPALRREREGAGVPGVRHPARAGLETLCDVRVSSQVSLTPGPSPSRVKGPSRELKIAVIAGDGIGPEVIDAAIPAIDAVAMMAGAKISWERLPYGADHYLKTGETLPEPAFQHLQNDVDA